VNPQRDGRLGIGIIGAGKVGPVLGAALAGAGHAVVGIHAVSEKSIERAEAMLPGVPILDVPRLVEISELVIIAVPDDQLEDLVAGVAQTTGWQPGQILLHTSAGFGTDVLIPATAQGAIPLALHPAMNFTGTSIDIARLCECYIAVTAPTPVLPIGQALAVELGGEPLVLAEDQRPAYARALKRAHDFSSQLVEESLAELSTLGIDNPAKVVAPVIRSTVENTLGQVSPTHYVYDISEEEQP
jgi:predicted short-subunit dehydrogenase-like oxidoreductase (DUF2520 family)